MFTLMVGVAGCRCGDGCGRPAPGGTSAPARHAATVSAPSLSAPGRTVDKGLGHGYGAPPISARKITQIVTVPIRSAQSAERLTATRFVQAPTANIATQTTSSAGQPITIDRKARLNLS